ncbi:MAG: tripartite tricarboxylate transporter substrate binding protein [Burkholderiales bacterium]|nr:tripartite tricarboxylate transporter substrate binding protein [Burkholderiales bacterium]
MKSVSCRWLMMLIAALAVLSPVHAQQYPTKPLRLIVPYPPGGGTDTIARVFALKLSEAIGQQVVLDNRPGAGANLGLEIAAKTPPDGYTLLLATIANTISASLYAKLNYDLVRDFAPVTLLATTPHIVVVHPSLPVKSARELITFAKARPGQITYSSSGSGTPAHLAGELFASMTGVKMIHVPYKGGGPSVIALVGGEVSVGFPTMPSVIGHIKAGKMRALALTTAKRSPSLPDLVTLGESAVPGYDVGSWYGLLVPAATPKEIITRLHAETLKVLRLPDTLQRLDAAGFEVLTSTPEEYGAFTRSEIEKWAKVVKASGARAN